MQCCECACVCELWWVEYSRCRCCCVLFMYKCFFFIPVTFIVPTSGICIIRIIYAIESSIPYNSKSSISYSHSLAAARASVRVSACVCVCLCVCVRAHTGHTATMNTPRMVLVQSGPDCSSPYSSHRRFHYSSKAFDEARTTPYSQEVMTFFLFYFVFRLACCAITCASRAHVRA